MPFIKVYVHFVWSTKYRVPYLAVPEIRKSVWNILNNGRGKGIFVDCVNGYADYCHCLISLKSDQSIAHVVRMLKGESSYWINQNKMTPLRFSWQNDYYVSSIDPSRINVIRNYILNQENHHRRIPLNNEIEDFLNSKLDGFHLGSLR